MPLLLRTAALLALTLLLSLPLNAADRPNVLLVVADDMGFSDLGSFGGEIATPNLDRLAYEGLRLNNFHTAATCSPTRAMLMSGVDHHLAGLGSMAEILAENQRGQPGYEGYLNERVVSLATRMREADYRTYMVGKWHLGKTEALSPAARGFDRSFALLDGGGNHYNEVGMFPHLPRAHYREGGQPANLPDDFYSSRFYTDKLLSYLREANSDRPFFAYLAYTAPHWPLQAPREVIEKYRGRYDAGYDVLRQQRTRSLVSLGIIPEGTEQRLDHLPGYRPWNELSESERGIQARTMEVYAAMIDEMDRQVGRLLGYLAETGELDNTLVIFLSDNGAEGVELASAYNIENWLATEFDNRLENLGAADSYIYQGPGWASAVMAPFYQVKRSAAEGGIRTPAFVWYPGFKRQADSSDHLMTVKDIAPTILELAGQDYRGSEYAGKIVETITGRSWAEYMAGEPGPIHSDNNALAWELFGHRAVRRGPWKLVSLQPPYGDGQWQLFNLQQDPAEQNNLAVTHPEKVQQLMQDWETYANTNAVILPEQ